MDQWGVGLQIGFAGNDLPIRILHPDPHDLFIGQVESVLQVEQTCDQARPQGRATMLGPHGLIGDLVDGIPVDELANTINGWCRLRCSSKGKSCHCAGSDFPE